MARSHPASYAKRAREAAKRAKRQEKADKRARRKAGLDGELGPDGEPLAEGEAAAATGEDGEAAPATGDDASPASEPAGSAPEQ